MPVQPERTESEEAATRQAAPGHLRPRLREKLPELLLEAASVVFAVLLAFAVDEWRETRSRQALADRARTSILEEIRANAAELRRTLDSNRAMLKRLEEDLLRVEAGEEPPLEVNFSIALLSSASWQTAQVTQAAHFVDYDWVTRVSRIYELQSLYVTNQTSLLDRIDAIPERVKDDPQRMLEVMTQRVKTVLNFQTALLEGYEEILKAGR